MTEGQATILIIIVLVGFSMTIGSLLGIGNLLRQIDEKLRLRQ